MENKNLDVTDFLTRILKFLIIGFMISITSYMIPKNKPTIREIIMIGCSSSLVFALIDIYAPTIVCE